jgi:hypothetical protein
MLELKNNLNLVKFFYIFAYNTNIFLEKWLCFSNLYINFYYFNKIVKIKKPKVISKKKKRWNIFKKKASRIRPVLIKSLYKSFYKRFGTTVFHGFRNIRRRWWRKTWNYKFRYSIKKRFRKYFFRTINPKRLNFLKFTTVNILRKKPYKMRFSIRQRLFLSEKTLTRGVWHFLYTSIKHKLLERVKQYKKKKKFFYPRLRRKTILLNAHKPLIWKMRKARYAHWNLRTMGKLNQWRYDKLLAWELRNLVESQSQQMLAHILLRSYRVVLSWRQMLLLISNQLIVINGQFYFENVIIKWGDIIELPFYKRKKSKKIKNAKYTFRKIVRRAKRTSYKSFLARKNKKIKKNTKIPKIFKRLPVGYKKLGAFLARDSAINVFAVIYPIEKWLHDIGHEISLSSVLTLQNWRYRFD